ncbi:non-classical arabinogalactan protein 31-like [Rhodamnia argentea]|uniref:Non-classical arabinogalactan protein 31-like n=1 Tax=Rhodamnia argentea TaxID=178133 RepID=A0A8B8N865_9MYRT|nr:non-classical arabinogalactan protein 31-like [Rhodamnia argentea]
MDSVPCKAFLLVQLLFLLSCFQEASCVFPSPPVHPPTWHDHGHPLDHSPSPAPSLAPFHPPGHPPIKPPAQPPVKPPVYNPLWRKFIAVQGVVYCKSCKETLDGSDKPIFGAQVKLLCKNTRYSAAVATATTDKNGYFFLQAPKTVTSFASHKCKAYLVSSPISSCSQPSNLNGGVTGATLRWEMWPSIKYPFILYSVGPFAFKPKCKAPGPK